MPRALALASNKKKERLKGENMRNIYIEEINKEIEDLKYKAEQIKRAREDLEQDLQRYEEQDIENKNELRKVLFTNKEKIKSDIYNSKHDKKVKDVAYTFLTMYYDGIIEELGNKGWL